MSGEREIPHYAGHRKRLRNRFLTEGLVSFADYEALELLLTYSVPRGDVKPAAKNLLARFGSLSAVMDAPADELTKVAGIGDITAAFITLIKEMNWRYMETKIESGDYLTSPGR